MGEKTSITLDANQIQFFAEKPYNVSLFIRNLIDRSPEYIEWKDKRMIYGNRIPTR